MADCHHVLLSVSPLLLAVYVVVDSLLGHFAANGFAPIPSGQVANIKTGMDTATTLLAKGK